MGSALGIQWAGAREAVQHLATYRTATYRRPGDPASYVHGAEVEKPCHRGLTLLKPEIP